MRTPRSKIELLNFSDGDYFTISLPNFTFPKKMFGKLDLKVEKVLKTFSERDKNLGVLMSGLKGNSKTTLAKLICRDSSMPVIVITEPYTGSDFKRYLSSLKQECIIFIDEFEKVYNTDDLQQEFLTILDGSIGGKKLFIFTSNSSNINTYLKNRPSRIYYHFRFDNLDKEVIDEIIESELLNKDFSEELKSLLLIIGDISIDILLNIIDEINRFNISPKVLVKDLNLEIERTSFNVTLLINGDRFTTMCDFNPLTVTDFNIYYKDNNDRFRWFSDSVSNYTMYVRGDSFVYESRDNKLIFSPHKAFKFEL